MKGHVILRQKVDRNFTTMPNETIQDKRLSWKALGLLIYLVHLPPNFKLRLSFLSELRPGNGRDLTRSGLKELEAAGYLEIVRERASSGKYGQTTWWVTNIPDGLQADVTTFGFSERGFPEGGRPEGGEPERINKK